MVSPGHKVGEGPAGPPKLVSHLHLLRRKRRRKHMVLFWDSDWLAFHSGHMILCQRVSHTQAAVYSF